VDSLVVLGDGLGVVVPSLFSAFQESACSGTLELTLHHVASFVLQLDALGTVVLVPEERNHVDLLFLSSLLQSGVNLVFIRLVAVKNERRGIHGAAHGLTHSAA